MKVLIAVPTFETICPEVFKSIYDMDTTGHEVDFEFVKGYDCAMARNEIGKLAKEGKYDYVLMVDADTIIPGDTLQCLLEHPVDVVSGVCPRKNTKDGSTALAKMGQPNYTDCYKYADLADERLQVKGCGFACVLIKTDVFERLPFPWFKYINYQDGRVLSEDFYFCDVCGTHGIEIYADTRVRCGHLARYFQYK